MLKEIMHIFCLDRGICTLKNNEMLYVKPELLYQFRTEVCKQHLIQSRGKATAAVPLTGTTT